MPRLNASDAAEKWARRTKGATEDVKKGVERVSTAPSQQAVAKQEKMKQNLIASIDDGTWAKNLEAYDLPSWKKDMLSKAIQRIAGGVDGSKDYVQQVMQKLLSFEATVQSEIDAMPDMTLEDSIARSNHWIRRMAEFKL